MAYVVTVNCLGTKDRSCVEVCPVDCFYNIKKKKYNDKYEDSGVPENLKDFVALNSEETTSMSESDLDAARCTSK